MIPSTSGARLASQSIQSIVIAMRTIIVLLISVSALLSASESNPRVVRVLETFESSATSAEAAYQAAIRAAEEARAKALSDARDRALRDLKRLVNRRSEVAEQAEVYTQVLRLDREDEDAVRFFTAIGTLEHVLKNLEPLVETDLLGNVIGAGGPQTPSPTPANQEGFALLSRAAAKVGEKTIVAVRHPGSWDKVGERNRSTPDGTPDGRIDILLRLSEPMAINSITVQGRGTWSTNSNWIIGVYDADGTHVNPEGFQDPLTENPQNQWVLSLYCNDGENRWGGGGVKPTIQVVLANGETVSGRAIYIAP